ncbi:MULTISPECIES: hypothetical protein [Stenotrophomonas]|nr:MULTISPECIES: hypothetical protein [Stenotrophomonas]
MEIAPNPAITGLIGRLDTGTGFIGHLDTGSADRWSAKCQTKL